MPGEHVLRHFRGVGLARGASTSKKRLKASVVAPAAPVVPSKPVGIPGGGNFAGRIQTIEPNQLLREQNAFGRAGTQNIGEWADLALTNPFVTAGLDFICAPIADARIDIEVDEEDEGSQQVVDFLRWALEKRFRLAAHNDTAARGFLVSGFALFEPRAELVHCPVLGRDVFALAALEQRLPNSLSPNAWREVTRTFTTDEGTFAETRLDHIEQQGPRGADGQWATVKLPAKNTLLYSWKRLGNNWAGESQLRSVWYLAARIMPLLLKLIGVTTQREGAGLPVVFAKDDNKGDITPEQRSELMTFLANVSFHESSGIIMPQGYDVRWEFSQGADKGFVLDIWKALGLVILQQLGAQQMALGTDNTGSRSVGEVHDARAMAFVRKVLSFQEGVLNGDGSESHTGLVTRLLRWNGLLAADGSAPRVKLTPKRPEMALKELAEAMASLKGAGLFTATHADENVLRERAGLPPISEEERDAAKEKAAALAPQLQPGFPKPGVEKDEKDEPLKASAQRLYAEELFPREWADASRLEDLIRKLKAGGSSDDDLLAQLKTAARCLRKGERATADAVVGGFLGEHLKTQADMCITASAQRTPWQPWRPLRASEQGVKFGEIAEYLDGRREEFERRMRPLVVLMLSKASPALDAAMADGVISPQEISSVPLAMGPLMKALGKYLAEDRKAGAEFLRAEMAGRLRAAADEEDDKDDTATVVREADEVISAVGEQLGKRMENRLRSELAREAIDVLRTGGDATEVWTRAVARQIESGAFKADAGTVTTKAFAVGRDEAARIMGGIASVELSALLDSRTCEVCERLDGTTAAFDSPEHDRLLPPVRDCDGRDACRCLLVMIPERGGE